MNNDWEKYKEQILARLRWEDVYKDIKNQKPGTDGWVSGLCPFHKDSKNSFAFHKQNLNFVCFAGCGKGSVFDFLVQSTGRPFKNILNDLGKKLNISPPQTADDKPPIKEELLQKYTKDLTHYEELQRYLREERGLTDEVLKKYQIGWDMKRQRISIPVRDEYGKVVNIRYYQRESKKNKDKMLNHVSDGGKYRYGSPIRLYGADELYTYKGKQVLITEGEWDRLMLVQEGYMAVSGTGGCGAFKQEWIPFFKDKEVIIIYDCDKEGQEAVNRIVLKALKRSGAKKIKNIRLPLKGTKDEKDITDYFKKGYSREDLDKLISETAEYQYPNEEKKEEEIIPLASFTEIEDKKYIDKRISCEITVCGETSEAFHAVEEFTANHCSRGKQGNCHNCAEPRKVPINSQEYIGSCMSTNAQLIASLRDFCCTYGEKPVIKILKRTTIKEFFCHQKVHRITQVKDKSDNVIQYIDGKKEELMEKRVYYLSSENLKPGSYLATGYVKTHPKTQAVTFLIEKMVPQEEDYQSFKLEENIVHLQKFQQFSLAEILSDLSENVTRIFYRDEILSTILLTYCSPLWIPFNGEIIRGWVVSVIIGDSGTGKSQSYTRLSEFMNVGDCFSALTGSRTGLAYALVEHKQKGWQVKIGRYPANSRKILAVDEAQFLEKRDIEAIQKAMDEGFLQIDRVKSHGYESQTRMIMICNPKKDKIMNNFLLGCEAIKELFNPPVIRRIDLATFVGAGETKDLDFINKKVGRKNSARITPEMLRAVVYWAWNLKAHQIEFTEEATDRVLLYAGRLSEMYGYSTDIPLVPPADFRKTIARLSTAVAVLLLSTDENFTKLIVREKHVETMVNIFKQIYSHKNCGLDIYSKQQKKKTQLEDYEEIEQAFLDRIKNEKHAEDEGIFIRTIYNLCINDKIQREDLAAQVDCEKGTVSRIISFLRKFNLIDSSKTGYEKKPKFNMFLRRFNEEHEGLIGF